MQNKRVVTDFRHLNTRIAKNNLAYPLIKDKFVTLGNSKCDVLLTLDLKDSFHSEIVRKFKEVLWNFAIFWKCLIFIPRNANGTKCFPINLAIIYKYSLDCLESRKYCEVIMDNLLLFTPSKQSHMTKLEDILKALLKNSLKISPKKCQLFRKEFQYMGNTIFIQEKRVCIRPLHNRLEAIERLKPPTTVKGCRSFAEW